MRLHMSPNDIEENLDLLNGWAGKWILSPNSQE
jgi:hypothetical protein